MKYSVPILCALVICVVAFLGGCTTPVTQGQTTASASTLTLPCQPSSILSVYSDIISGDIPKDIRLTIYYIDPSILTFKALSIDDLINLHNVKKIVVEYETLTTHTALLSKLNPSILEPIIINFHLNARLYYVIETETHGKILEVAVSQVGENVFVNGIEVKHNPVFYEVIVPFLSEDDIAILFGTGDGL